MNQQKDYIQLIYRLLVGLLGIGFLYVIWPYISSVLLMLVFASLLLTKRYSLTLFENENALSSFSSLKTDIPNSVNITEYMTS